MQQWMCPVGQRVHGEDQHGCPSQPERNQFKYKLINNDNDWIEAGNNHIAHYTNLPPNDYQFQVISSNYDGVWNETPATYNFKILKLDFSLWTKLLIYLCNKSFI